MVGSSHGCKKVLCRHRSGELDEGRIRFDPVADVPRPEAAVAAEVPRLDPEPFAALFGLERRRQREQLARAAVRLGRRGEPVNAGIENRQNGCARLRCIQGSLSGAASTPRLSGARTIFARLRNGLYPRITWG